MARVQRSGGGEPFKTITFRLPKAPEAWLGDFMDGCTDGFLWFDGRLNCEGMNRAARELFNVPEDAAVGRSILDIMHEAEDLGTYQQYLDVIRTGEHFVTRCRRGEMYLGIKAFRVGHGLGVIVSDITERRLREEVLEEAEEYWRILFDSLEDAVFVIDGDYNLQNINDSGLALVGKSREEVLGQKCFQAIWGRHRPDGYCPVPKRPRPKKAGTGDREMRGRYFSVNVSPILDEHGTTVRFVEILRDITESRQREGESRVKNTAIESCPSAVAVADCEGNLTYVNPSFLRMWQYDGQERILGKPLVKLWHNRYEALKAIEALRGEGSWTGELTAKRKGGSTFEVEFSASMIRDNRGKPVGMVACFTDITGRKLVEQKLGEYEARFGALAAKSVHWAERLNAVLKDVK